MNKLVIAAACLIASTAVPGAPAAAQHAAATTHAMPDVMPEHVITITSNGGRMEAKGAPDDAATAKLIRDHLREVSRTLAAGTLDSPAAAPARCIPGATAMSALHSAIRYELTDVPGGAAVSIASNDVDAIAAIHEFLNYHKSHHAAMATAHGSGASHGTVSAQMHDAMHSAGCAAGAAEHTDK